jgi:hypothetical protein
MGINEDCLSKRSLRPMRRILISCFVVDGIPKLTKLFGEGLEMLAVNANGGVTLNSTAKLRVKGVDTGVNIVLEKLAEGRPESGGAGGGAED